MVTSVIICSCYMHSVIFVMMHDNFAQRHYYYHTVYRTKVQILAAFILSCQLFKISLFTILVTFIVYGGSLMTGINGTHQCCYCFLLLVNWSFFSGVVSLKIGSL